ncbi:MAG: cytochrome c [Ghiorsea sp.]|nr:cytochrome c [Ghiorsea sp.]
MLKKHYACHVLIALAAATMISIPLSTAEEATLSPSSIEENKPSIKDQIKMGKVLFTQTCKHCHTVTYEESAIGAPGLRSVLERHDEAWLHQWIKSPETFAVTNVTARDLIDSNQFGLAMPTLPAMQHDDKRSAVIEYLKTLK